MKLYEITNDTRELQAMADSGELSAEDIADTLDGLDIQFDQKVKAALSVRQSMLANASGISGEIERLFKLQRAAENNAERINEYIKSNMLALGKDSCDLGIFKVSLRKATVQLADVDMERVPSGFFNLVPASRSLDRKRLLAAAKKGDIVGVELGKSSRALIIK